MRRILFTLFLLIAINDIYCQTEWKIIGGIDFITNVRDKKEYNYDTWQGRYFYETNKNLGYCAINCGTGGKKLRTDLSAGFGIYKNTTLIEFYGANDNFTYFFDIGDSTISDNESIVIRPMIRASMNYELGRKYSFKILAFNHGFTSLMGGITLERKLGTKLLASASLYLPIQNFDASYNYYQSEIIGGGIQVSYVFARKEKVKKEKIKKGKSSSSPTVL